MTDSDQSSNAFSTTQWTRVIQVIQRADAAGAAIALEESCQQYRDAIYSFIRRRGYSHEHAEDLVHEFFKTRILEKWKDRESFVHEAQRGKKFRSFLSHVLIRFLQDQTKANQ